MCSVGEKSYNRKHKSNNSYEGDLWKLKFENTIIVCGKTEMLTYLLTLNSFFVFLRPWNHPAQNATCSTQDRVWVERLRGVQGTHGACWLRKLPVELREAICLWSS